MAHLETSKKRVIFGTPDAELVATRRLVAICLAAENSFVVRRSVDCRSEVETGSELPLFLSHDRIGHFYIYTGLGGLRHHVIEARPPLSPIANTTTSILDLSFGLTSQEWFFCPYKGVLLKRSAARMQENWN